jgi:S-adenosylmethionine synthetase
MSRTEQRELFLAEEVLPGHPDRLADAIAEQIVDNAMHADSDALVGVEVGVHRHSVFVTGRVAATMRRGSMGLRFPVTLDLLRLVANAYADAGYRDGWAQRPRILADLDVDRLPDAEQAIRHFSDDQSVTVGHACGGKETRFLPPASFAARAFRSGLARARSANADSLGPDGKVLVVLEERGGRFRLDRLCVSIQHAAGLSAEEQHRLLLPALEEAAAGLDAALPGLGASWAPELVRLNGAGDFSVGGPHGDNGLSGKKLAVDHYGPHVPIGGGALCGKDPHKVDRVGALRARQVALRLVRDAGLPEATVWLGWQPGREIPDVVFAKSGATTLDRKGIARLAPLPDLSIQGTFHDLELEGVSWVKTLADGYFGNDWPWER